MTCVPHRPRHDSAAIVTGARVAAASITSSLLCGLLALLVGCSGDRPPGRVLLIGIDGASPRIVEPLMAAGRLPNLARIAREGHYEPLLSIPPYLSPRVWTSIATGKRPVKHGILNWVRPVGEKEVALYRSDDRRGEALWNMVSDAGMSVGVVNWLVTYPPEVVNGVMVSTDALPGAVAGEEFIGAGFARAQGRTLRPVEDGAAGPSTIYPESWRAELLAPRLADATLTDVPDPFETAKLPAGAPVPQLIDDYRRDQRLTAIALEVEEKLHPRVLMVLLQGIDQTSHFLWGCVEDPSTYPPTFQPTAEERTGCREALYEYYRFTDALIGRLVTRFEPRDLVMVVSDHGFEVGFGGLHLTGEHNTKAASHGVLFARGAHVEATATPASASVLDVTPTILAWLRLPVAGDMDGHVAGFLRTPVPARIATWDTKPIARLGHGPSGAEKQIIDKLRSLGYVQ